MSENPVPRQQVDNANEHQAILNELKLMRADNTREMNAIREDLKQVLQVTREEHKEQLEEIKGWMRRVEGAVNEIDKKLIRVDAKADEAKKESSKNTNWQTWAGRVILGAVFLGMVGVLIKGAW